ncbi:uncharacterized protein [Procambarus clarkii]|uniref:uncharacterized protein n=1 Tax=Procambarus clarkii TaxID=6728 RepID=UPI0037442BA8
MRILNALLVTAALVGASPAGPHGSGTWGASYGAGPGDHVGASGIIRAQLVGRHTSTTGGSVGSVNDSYRRERQGPTIIRAELVGRHTSTTGGSAGSVDDSYRRERQGPSIIRAELVGRHTSTTGGSGGSYGVKY